MLHDLFFLFRLFPELGFATAEITVEIRTKIWYVEILPPDALPATNQLFENS